MDTSTTTVDKRSGSPINQPSKKSSVDPNMDTTSSAVEKRIASPTKQPSKKLKPSDQPALPAPQAKKTSTKTKTSYTAPESSAKILSKSRVNIQSAYEILAGAVNKKVIIGADAIEINDLIKNNLSTDPKDKTKKAGTNTTTKNLATARLKELYAKHYEILKKHHQSK